MTIWRRKRPEEGPPNTAISLIEIASPNHSAMTPQEIKSFYMCEIPSWKETHQSMQIKSFLLRGLEVYMIINFRARDINKNIHKLIRISILIKNKKSFLLL